MKWKSQKTEVQNFVIPRCYKPPRFGKVKKAEFHQLTGMRASRTTVSPATSEWQMKAARFTIPSLPGRQELHLWNWSHSRNCSSRFGQSQWAVNVERRIGHQHYQWRILDDSRVILGVFANDVRRFHVFVANRVQEIPKNRLQSNRQCFQGQSPTEFRKWIKVPEFRDCGVRTLRHTHPAYTDCALIPNYTLTPFIWDSGCGH